MTNFLVSGKRLHTAEEKTDIQRTDANRLNNDMKTTFLQ